MSEQPILGAGAIANFIFGDPAKARSIYHLAETSQIPIVRFGAQLAIYPSTYKRWRKEQEEQNSRNARNLTSSL